MKGLSCRKRSIKYYSSNAEYTLSYLNENYSIFDNTDEFKEIKTLIWRSSSLCNPSKRLYNKSCFNDIESLKRKSCATFIIDGG